MTFSYCESLFSDVELYSQYKSEPVGWQRIYWQRFGLDSVQQAEALNPDSLFLSYSSPRRKWINNAPYNKAMKWGQLKLFLSHLQPLVTFWDTKLVPHLTVVYAGFAPGLSIAIVDALFPGMISWHLYDTNPYYLGDVKDFKVYNQWFTDEDARKWSKVPNVFFFTDVRSVSFSEEYRLAGKIDPKSEAAVKDDMAMQRGWIEIMKPYQACLKMKLPYVLKDKSGNLIPHTTSYLEGNIMIQSFNQHASSETRLIPLKRCDGTYYIKDYDDILYEEQMFYHNYVNKEAPSMGIEETEYIKNTYEYAHLLYVFELYKSIIETDNTPIELATDAIIELHEMKSMQIPRWNTTKNGKKLKHNNDGELIKEFNKGSTIEELAKKFDRSERAITTRLMHIQRLES